MLLDEYSRLCLENGWQSDEVQIRAVRALEEIHLTNAGFGSRLKQLFQPKGAQKGIYLHGGVGRGKTSMMDLFYQKLPAATAKKRYHFHEFMQYIHDELFKAGKSKIQAQPIDIVVRKLAKTKLLCLDDLEVTEIGDAMIICRLFAKMIDAGITIVLTSNCTPGDLYKNGLHYERFEPFVGLIQEHFKIISFDGESTQDYRRLQHENTQSYFAPLTQSVEFHAKVKEQWGGNKPEPVRLYHHGRCIYVPKSVEVGEVSVAHFTFAELCEQPLAANDYQKIASSFNMICVEGVPYFDKRNKDETRRFIKLVDTLYDNNVQLICLAVDHPDKLYKSQGLPFARTASRLVEMGGL